MEEWQPSITGIDLDIAGDQRMKRAVLATMAALDSQQSISQVDAAEIQSLIISAEMIDRDSCLSRSSVAAVNRHTATQQALAAFVASHADGSGGADWDAMLADLTAVKDVAL